MHAVNIHEARTHLSRLVDETAKGEPLIIAKSGKPVAKVTALDAPTGAQKRRLGFLAGQIAVPEDFDRMGSPEIEQLWRRRMKLLFDTHLLLWAAGEPGRLPARARALIKDPANELIFSAASLASHFVTLMLRQGDAEVFKRCSQAKLSMMREALAKLDRHANEHEESLVTARPN